MQYKSQSHVHLGAKYKTVLILKAAEFAARAHSNQKRKTTGEPYVNHLLRVAHDVAEAGFDENVIAAALLHDVVEDTDTGFEDLEEIFPSRVVELVRLMTQWWPDQAPQEVKKTEGPKYYAAIAKDPDAIALKLFDRADNLNDMAKTVHIAPKWAERYLVKSEREIAPLIDSGVSEKAAQAFHQAINKLRNSLEQYHGRQKNQENRTGH